MRRGQRRPGAPIGDPSDPHGLWTWTQRYLEWLTTHHFTTATLRHRRVYLGYFLTWCEARSLRRPTEITRPILERYQRHLYAHRKANGHPLSFRSQEGRLAVLRGFFRWMVRENALLANPAADLIMPRAEKRLPRAVLSPLEADTVMNQPDLTEPLGVRDRAMLETLYSTGMRRSELLHLKVDDLDIERGTVFIRQGKGRKDRLIPIGERAIAWVEKYLGEVRPGLVVGRDDGFLFLTELGESMVPEYVTHRMRRYVEAADLGKKGSCHIFRHAMATAMLDNGADVRFVQEMLGHASLATTQIYTHLSIGKLKKIHTMTHPSATMKGLTKKAAVPVGEAVTVIPEVEREALLCTLDAENDDPQDGV
jgi:integrase/recombinase XerD